MALSFVNRTLFTCNSEGIIQVLKAHQLDHINYQGQVWNDLFDNVAAWKGHAGITLSSFVIHDGNNLEATLLMTGGNDGNIKVTGPIYLVTTFYSQ